MHRVTANIEKNRLIISLAGFITEEEAAAVKKSIIAESATLSTGFDIITDITLFRLGLPGSERVFRDILKIVEEKRVNRIVRVVGGAQAGMVQFANHTGNEHLFKVKYVPTMDAAEKALEEKEVAASV